MDFFYCFDGLSNCNLHLGMQLLFDVSYVLPGLNIELKWLQMFIPMIFALMLFRILQVYWQWKNTGWKGLPL